MRAARLSPLIPPQKNLSSKPALSISPPQNNRTITHLCNITTQQFICSKTYEFLSGSTIAFINGIQSILTSACLLYFYVSMYSMWFKMYSYLRFRVSGSKSIFLCLYVSMWQKMYSLSRFRAFAVNPVFLSVSAPPRLNPFCVFAFLRLTPVFKKTAAPPVSYSSA